MLDQTTCLEGLIIIMRYTILLLYVQYRLDVELLKNKGIPAGPLYGQLKSGKTITHNGVTIQSEDVVGPPRPGKKIGMWSGTATFIMTFQDRSL